MIKIILNIGVILFVMLSGYPPFFDKDCKAIAAKILKGTVTFEGIHWCLLKSHIDND